MKHVFLYFGSFNPIHKGHMALAEHVIGQGLCDGVIFIVSPQNPLKEADGLMPELARFEMVETACLESKYPQAIQASAIEFLLDKPSYTIDTLRYLTQNHGKEMRFSVLMGADIIPQLDKWKDYRELLDKYDIYVYPRKGYAVDRYLDRITYLADAPTFEYSSTEIRERAARGEHRERARKRHAARGRDTGGDADHVGLGDAGIEEAVGIGGLELAGLGRGREVRVQNHEIIVLGTELDERLAIALAGGDLLHVSHCS